MANQFEEMVGPFVEDPLEGLDPRWHDLMPPTVKLRDVCMRMTSLSMGLSRVRVAIADQFLRGLDQDREHYPDLLRLLEGWLDDLTEKTNELNRMRSDMGEALEPELEDVGGGVYGQVGCETACQSVEEA